MKIIESHIGFRTRFGVTTVYALEHPLVGQPKAPRPVRGFAGMIAKFYRDSPTGNQAWLTFYLNVLDVNPGVTVWNLDTGAVDIRPLVQVA